ncbi:MAG: hypothetical protein H0T46_14335, partial [Deltaproteobacteria bacterium]|nr:hypothetical protein [Deltaproteobacteria bacterium]
MRILWSLLLLAGCKSADDYPPLGGGGGGGGGGFGTMVDAPGADTGGGDGTMVTGRVCLIADLRTPNACAATGAANITVQLGTETTMTADDGMFSVMASGGTNLVWRVSGSGLVSSTVPRSTSNNLPIITADLYNDILGANGVILNSGEGSLVLYASQGGAPLMGAAVTVAPAATYLPMRDTGDPLTWVQGGTGGAGVSWTPGVTVG